MVTWPGGGIWATAAPGRATHRKRPTDMASGLSFMMMILGPAMDGARVRGVMGLRR
jgi:hypothetical protein